MMKIVCALLLVAAANARSTGTSSACLPDIESGRCYKLYEEELGGYDCIQAELKCLNNNGVLAVFDNQKDYDNVYDALKSMKPGTMILTGMKYMRELSRKKPCAKKGDSFVPVGFTPHWFEDHPIIEPDHSEMIVIASQSKKYSGMMNAKDGCRYNVILCEEYSRD